MDKIYIALFTFLIIHQVISSPINNDQENYSQKNNTEISEVEPIAASQSRTSLSNIQYMNVFELMKILMELIMKNLGNASAMFTNPIIKVSQFMEQKRSELVRHLNGTFSTSIDNTENAIEMVANSAQIIIMSLFECINNQRVTYQSIVNGTIGNFIDCGYSNVRDFGNVIERTRKLSEITKETLTNVVSGLMNCENVTNNVIEYGFCASNILRSSSSTIMNMVNNGMTLVIDASNMFKILPTKLAVCVSSNAVNFVINIAKLIGEIERCVAVAIY